MCERERALAQSQLEKEHGIFQPVLNVGGRQGRSYRRGREEVWGRRQGMY